MTLIITKMLYNIIVAYELNRGIGFQNKIPWRIPPDMKRFKEITSKKSMNCVVMGRKTWDSIPPKFRPLSDRINIILSQSMNNDSELNEANTYVCRSFDDFDDLINKLSPLHDLSEIFFIGGEQIYKEATRRYKINKYYLTQVLQKYECDSFLSDIDLSGHKLIESSTHTEKTLPYRFQVYELIPSDDELAEKKNAEETNYLNCLKDVLERGQYRDDRTEVGTLSLFEGKQFVFDLSKTFPLLTTKRVFFRGLAEELFFFFSGLTNAKILQEKDVHIWDDNSSREYLDKIGQSHREVGDLGKFYGFQWRHWGAEYLDCHQDYKGQGFDQIQMIIDLIKNSPTSRRILVSAWNPGDLKEMALPPCHIVYQFYVDVENKTLSCSMYQRSADLFLGVPFNIASTALFTCLLAKTCDLKPSKVIVTLGDSHIYLNHIQQVLEQISRDPRQFPTLNIKTKREKLEDYCFDDLELINYNPYGKIAAKMAV